jgi:cobalt-zinc-cadmium efflux system membrane fusion protein
MKGLQNIVIHIVITGLILVFNSCGNGKTENTPKSTIKEAFLENVKTVRVVLRHQEQELILTGKVEYDPDKIIHYAPLMSGVITQTCFSLGNKVNKGETMLHIRSTELSSLQSELTIARRNVQSAELMYVDKIITERELIEARATREKLEADLSLYGENMGGGIFAVKSPMTGYVVDKKVSAGSTVSEGDAVFSIANLSTVWVMANVYAGNLQFVREGMDVEMTSFSYPDELFYGKIDALSQVFDPEERVLKARIVMNNNDLKLKPEMLMLVTVKDKTPRQFMAVPSDALIFDDNKYFVIVEEKEGVFVVRNVVPQGHHDKISYISLGLLIGEKVVVTNQLLIYQGLKEE